MKTNETFIRLFLTAAIATLTSVVSAEPVTLTIESWRNDDLPVWQQQIIPAFEKNHPDIKVRFTPLAPAEYNAALTSKLEAGTAGDLISCRPFDSSLLEYQKGQLTSVNDIKGMDNFTALAKTAWTTDDGRTTYCVPMAAVLHGFIYNKDAFDRLGIKPPVTVDEFFRDLDKIKADGKYIPLAMGTKDGWETASMGYQNIGPNYYKGEAGRKALLAGKQKMTDPDWVAPWQQLARWKPYLGKGFQAQSYPDSQNLFELGRAAIYPAGSWEIANFEKQAHFKMGVFKPPVEKAGDQCYISDHPDIGLGANAKSAHLAQARVFLEWVASPEFANLYSNALPGFFSLQKTKVDLKDPLARDFLSWRADCGSSIRPFYQILSRGTPNLENDSWVEGSSVINGTKTPEQAVKELQAGLDSWYKPAK
jgi:raffinose/stachyose/melibiose transport system substrate-binding protein